MQVLDLVMLNGHTHRVLSLNEKKALVIDCDSLTMPQWVSLSSRLEVVDGTTSEFNNSRYEELSSTKKKSAHTRYTLIAPVLPFVSDEYMRARIIAQIAENENISKQTIRKYLCLYLAYQDIGHLVSCDKASKRTLTEDEKNFRWAINKFYYSPLKHTLKGSYIVYIFIAAPKCGMSRWWALVPLFSHVIGLVVFIVIRSERQKNGVGANTFRCPTCSAVHPYGTAVCSVCGKKFY